MVGQTTTGFILPEGYTWDAKFNDEGKKDGRVEVTDDDGYLSCVLQFKNDKRNGICEFYDSRELREMKTFVDDIEEGWGCELENREKVRCFCILKV